MTLVGIWVTRFLLTRLGAIQYGLWLVALQILGYLLLADFGVVALLPRETAYATERRVTHNSQDLASIIGHTFRIVLLQMPAVVLATAAAWKWLPTSWAALRAPFALVLVAFLVLFPLRILPAVLQGLQDLAYVSWVQLVNWVATTLTSIGLVLAGEGLSALAVGWVVGQLLSALLYLIRLRVRHPGVLPTKLPPFNWPVARTYLIKSTWMSVNQIAQVFLVGSDVIVIGAILGPAAVVPYACTSKLVSVIRNQPLLFVQTALPGLSEVRAREGRQRFSQVAMALMQGALVLSGAAACAILLSNRWFVGWWVGPEYYGGFLLTLLLVLNMVARHCLGSVAVSVFALGHEQRLALVILADGLTAVGGGVALIHVLGVAGAPLAYLTSVCAVSLPLLFRAYSREMDVPLVTLVKPILAWGVRFLVVAVPVVAIMSIYAPTTWTAAAIGTTAAILIYGLCQASLLARAPLAPYVPPRTAALLARFFPGRLAANGS
jgi:O-antigen/teichoic acid export membrane protein